MAAPMSAATMLAVARSTGLPVKTYPGWENRRRSSGGAFTPRGVAVHITAGGLGSRSALTYIRDIILGDPNVSFKAQFVTEPNGTIWLVGTGRANHAGSCSTRGRDAFTNGSWPTSGYTDWRGAAVNPGEFTYGIENIAASKMTPAQYDATVRLCAAICRHYGWRGGEVAGHGEFASDRAYADPNENMGLMRSRIMALVSGSSVPGTGAGGGGGGGGLPPGTSTPTKPPAPPKQEAHPMADLSDKDVEKIEGAFKRALTDTLTGDGLYVVYPEQGPDKGSWTLRSTLSALVRRLDDVIDLLKKKG